VTICSVNRSGAPGRAIPVLGLPHSCRSRSCCPHACATPRRSRWQRGRSGSSLALRSGRVGWHLNTESSGPAAPRKQSGNLQCFGKNGHSPSRSSRTRSAHWQLAPLAVYCQAVLAHDQRIALDGSPAEPVDARAKESATAQLARLAARKRRSMFADRISAGAASRRAAAGAC